MPRNCAHCGQAFQPHPQVPNQTYCSSAECQRARKLRWQQNKLRTDPDVTLQPPHIEPTNAVP